MLPVYTSLLGIAALAAAQDLTTSNLVTSIIAESSTSSESAVPSDEPSSSALTSTISASSSASLSNLVPSLTTTISSISASLSESESISAVPELSSTSSAASARQSLTSSSASDETLSTSASSGRAISSIEQSLSTSTSSSASSISSIGSVSSTGYLTSTRSSSTAISSTTSITITSPITTATSRSSSLSASSSSPDSSSSSSAPPSQPTSSCPASNKSVYNAPSGQQFVIECDLDHSGGDIGWNYAEDGLASCIALCGATDGCVDVSLTGSNACYMKSVVGQAVAYPGLQSVCLISGEDSTPVAPVVPVQCPSDNGTEYVTTGSNKTFVIECGTDYAGGDIASFDVDSREPGRDGSLWLQTCIELCGNTTACVDISLADSSCYLKGSLGTKGINPCISGARLISPLPSTPPPVGELCDTDNPTCPACNNTKLTSYDSEPPQEFMVECGIDHAGGDITGKTICTQECTEPEGSETVSKRVRRRKGVLMLAFRRRSVS